MLRSLKTAHWTPRLQGFQVLTAATPAATLAIGGQEATVARVAAGKATITLNEILGRTGIVVASPGVDAAAGSFAVTDTLHTGSAFKTEVLGAAGSGDDSYCHALTLGFEDAYGTDRANPLQSVKGVCASPRLLPFKIAAAGTIAIGGAQGSVSKASSVYTITPDHKFGRAPIVIATPIAAAAKACRITANAANAVAIECYDPVGAALEDNLFYCVIFGWDTPDIMSGLRRSIKIPQAQPRMEAFRITGTGTAVLAVGASDGTLTDNGTGDYTITFKEAFAREPIVLVTGKDGRAQCLAAATTTTCRVGSFNASNAALDDVLDVIVIGFDHNQDS